MSLKTRTLGYKTVISRKQWGAKVSLGSAKLVAKEVEGLVLHHTVTSPPRDHSKCAAAVRGIEAAHKAKEGSTVLYNYIYCNHGYIFECRPIPYRSGANGNLTTNKKYVAAAWLGDGTKKMPTLKARSALQRIRLYTMATYGYDTRKFLGHNQIRSTACPGTSIKKWVSTKGPEL